MGKKNQKLAILVALVVASTFTGCSNKTVEQSEKVAEVEYKNIKRFEVVTGERATEIGNETDSNSRDEYNEYLVITLEDGEISTFCNSHVDLFII